MVVEGREGVCVRVCVYVNGDGGWGDRVVW